MNYFAYGSNMDTERLSARVGMVSAGVRATLSGYALRFNKRAEDDLQGRANLVPQQGEEIEGVLFALSDEQCARLDVFEGEGYARHTVPVTTAEGVEEAMVYLAVPEFMVDDRAPSAEYAEYIVRGARQHGLSEAYIAKVAAAISALHAHEDTRKGLAYGVPGPHPEA